MTKRETQETIDLLVEAWHESGHAVGGWSRGGQIKEIVFQTATPKDVDESGEGVSSWVEWLPPRSPESVGGYLFRGLAAAPAMVKLARERGWDDRRHLNGAPQFDPFADFGDIPDLIRVVVNSRWPDGHKWTAEEVQDEINGMKPEVVAFIDEERTWRAVNAVGKALMALHRRGGEVLPGQRATAIIERAWRSS